MKNTLLALLGFILPAMPLTTVAQQSGDFTYTSDGSAITITGYTGPGGAVAVPETINNLPVRSIGMDAFSNQSSVTTVAIPGSVISISDGAFLNSSLTAVNVAAANLAYSSLDGVLFNKLQTLLVAFPGGKEGTYAVPASVTSIGNNAFFFCFLLTNVSLPSGLTNIGNEAFAQCVSLTNIAIPSGVVSVGPGAFWSCTSLTGVIIPGSVTSLGPGAFGNCTGLVGIMVDPANASYSSLDGVLFDKGLSTLLEFPPAKGGSYSIPESVTNIGISAFGYCTSLTNVTIPGTVLTIMGVAFDSCSSLTSVTILNGVASIESYAFAFCTSLTNVTIPGSVTNIGFAPFDSCFRLKAISVDTANSYYYSADGVLFDKTRATLIQYPGGKAGNYIIPNDLTNIGRWAFNGCYGLTGVTIPGSVTSLGPGAFGNCANLTNVTIADGVANIEDGAFYQCTSLTNVTIPGSVTNIGIAGFEFCTSMKGVFFKADAPGVLGANVFYSDDEATVYYLPGTTGWGATFGAVPTSLWNPLMHTSSVGPTGFGFNITGTADIPIVIEAATNTAGPTWVPLQSLNLTNGAFYFGDPDWTNYPARFYRIRPP